MDKTQVFNATLMFSMCTRVI